jgi:hypothetical protein
MQTSFGLHKQMSPIKHPFELLQICAMHLEYHLPHVNYKLDYIQGGSVSILVSNKKETSEVGLRLGGHILELSRICQNFAQGQTF